ncbi:MAG: Rieske (2Fe-2S) protein [Proteobacteria bacterium]|jgi:nitrite reductase/ring-hydroxylating ferredoxin subunit|nr:Rieske (2Fe-2S) protein [Pseudomonadota bacterium]
MNKITLSKIDGAPSAGEILCSVDDLTDNAAMEFSLGSAKETYDIFIQRYNGEIFAYVNVCPHAGTPLNMEDGIFMEKTGRYLMCHTHGALFEPSNGLCVAGPCNGASLQAVEIDIIAGNIVIL